MTETQALTPRQLAILDFERNWWALSGTKDAEIQSRFQVREGQYYQELNTLIDTPAALAQDPLLVKRLRRQRIQRRNAGRMQSRA